MVNWDSTNQIVQFSSNSEIKAGSESGIISKIGNFYYYENRELFRDQSEIGIGNYYENQRLRDKDVALAGAGVRTRLAQSIVVRPKQDIESLMGGVGGN